MRSPKTMLGRTFRARPDLALFTLPALTFLALLMLALLAWPVTASTQSPAGAGAQEAPPAATAQQSQPIPTAQPGSPATAAEATSQAQGTIRPQQPLTPEAVLDRIIAQEQAEVGLVRQYSPLV